ncbi:MAG: hypothetical protein AAF581_12300 [Planctomycetota bacterium]
MTNPSKKLRRSSNQIVVTRRQPALLACVAVMLLLLAGGCRSQGQSFHNSGLWYRPVGLTLEHLGEHRSSWERLGTTAELFRRGEHASGVWEAIQHGSAGQGGLYEASRTLFFDMIGPYDFYELDETFGHFR